MPSIASVAPSALAKTEPLTNVPATSKAPALLAIAPVVVPPLATTVPLLASPAFTVPLLSKFALLVNQRR